ELDMSELVGAEGRHLLIQAGANPRHLAPGDPAGHAQGADQVVELAGRHTVHVCLHDDGEQGPVDASTALENRREEAALAQLQDGHLDVARPSWPTAGRGCRYAMWCASSCVGTGRRRCARRFGIDQRLPHELDTLAITSMSPPARIASSSSQTSDWLRASGSLLQLPLVGSRRSPGDLPQWWMLPASTPPRGT